MQNEYLLIYKRWGIDFTESPDSWRKMTKLINYMDTYGGYPHTILVNNHVRYVRNIDDVAGNDYWIDTEENTVVNLEQIEYRR